MKKIVIRQILFYLRCTVLIIAISLCATFLSACGKGQVYLDNVSGSITPSKDDFSLEQVKQNDITEAKALYQSFLDGKIKAVSKYGEITLHDICRFDNNDIMNLNKYAYFDMNGDGIPELLTKEVSDSVYIFTIKDGKLVEWHDMIPNCTVLNTGDTITTDLNGGPTHLSYIYSIFDFNGSEKFSIDFVKYDDNEDGKYDDKDSYYFDDVKVSKKCGLP